MIYRVESIAKSGLLLFFLGFFIAEKNPGFIAYTNSMLAMSISLKRPANQTFDVLIAGGSNAQMGIAVRQMNQQGIKSHNLAISPREGGEFFDYIAWMASLKNRSRLVVYSSMDFWFFSANSPFGRAYDENFAPFEPPRTAVISQLRAMISPDDLEFHISADGDVDLLQPFDHPEPFPARLYDIDTINAVYLAQFIQRVLTIKAAVQAERVLVRVPPVYIEPGQSAALRRYVAQVQQALARHDIALVGLADAATFERSAMCLGSNHPCLAAKQQFTQRLIAELKGKLDP